ncbi:winged helix-turn-helix transcriptional regulator [Candidatus Saccharibacteria bacterium]|nr:winged helix-turn-helix transcriptional regulator [Candidatus Saccharibacteria bacterium]
MHPNNNVGYLLQHVAITMARQNDQVLQERLGIGFSQFKILMVLERSPHIQQRQIADALGQTEASISRQIRLMIDKSLLQSTVSPHNRREHITTPTTKGIRLAEEAMEVLNTFHSPMFERLSEKQQEQFVEILKNMHECICQAGKTSACDRPFNT